MTPQVKLLFDECVGSHIAEKLAQFLLDTGQNVEVKHIREFQQLGTPDEIWVPKLSALGYVTITGDRSKDPKKTKLKLLCVKFQMTLLMLATSVYQLKSADKAIALTAAWHKIMQVAAGPRGDRYMMSMSTGSTPTIWPMPITDEERRKAASYTLPNLRFELEP